MLLLARNQFRGDVFIRDNHACVICGTQGQDAHHIMERRLFPDGGYYLENGATLCSTHHIEAEQTILSCEKIREAAGIKHTILPPHLYRDQRYDKWGNPILQDGRRLRGELFWDTSVQKILAPVLDQFIAYVKYPRTSHLPWSPGITIDDRVLPSSANFSGKRTVVTMKMDGENTSLYRDYMHARSIDSKHGEDRHWMLNFHSQIGWQIPDGWRVCGENLYATHAIHYPALPHYFLAFSVWNDRNVCLSWDDTVEWCELLGLQTVPVLYDGEYDEELIQGLFTPDKAKEMEGYVVRLAEAFNYADFSISVGKYVRAGHVAGSHNWGKVPLVVNGLAN